MAIDLEVLKNKLNRAISLDEVIGEHGFLEIIEALEQAKEIIEWARPLQDAEPYAQPSIPKCKSWLHKFFPTQTKESGEG